MSVITVKDSVYEKLSSLAESQGLTINQYLERTVLPAPSGLSQRKNEDCPNFAVASKTSFLDQPSFHQAKKVGWRVRWDSNPGPVAPKAGKGASPPNPHQIDGKCGLPKTPSTIGTVLPGSSTPDLTEFAKFCQVDLRLSPGSVRRHMISVRQIIRECSDGEFITTGAIRDFLSGIENPYTYNNFLKSLRVYFRDYLNQMDVIRTFRFAHAESPPPRTFSKKDLHEFYWALEDELERALFLIYASSGKRRSEILDLLMRQIDLEGRTIMPTKISATKRTWYSFFNQEAQDALKSYLAIRRDVKRSGKLFPMSWSSRAAIFHIAQRKTGLELTPQDLRFWFSNEMSTLGVADRFIDAFQGRVPRSVLARHYTDYSLENLKAIYDKAALRVLP